MFWEITKFDDESFSRFIYKPYKDCGMKSIFLGLFVLCWSVVVGRASERELTINTPTGKVYGTLMAPEQDTKQVVVLLICGSGATDRDGNNPQMQGNSIRYLAEDLCAKGIASLRYDKRGVARSVESAMPEQDIRLSTYDRVVVVGHSEGAKIGTMASAGNSRVTGLVLLAGAGRPTDEILKAQIRQTSPMVLGSVSSIIDTLKTGRKVEQVPQMLYALFRPSVQPYLISDFAVDPVTVLRGVDVPVLIIQGDKDLQIGVEDARLLQEARPDAELVIIPNMNHVLKPCASTDMAVQMETYVKPDLRIEPQVACEIADFIERL